MYINNTIRIISQWAKTTTMAQRLTVGKVFIHTRDSHLWNDDRLRVLIVYYCFVFYRERAIPFWAGPNLFHLNFILSTANYWIDLERPTYAAVAAAAAAAL